MSEKFNIPAWKGTLIRIGDKWARLNQLAKKKAKIKDESKKDNLKDMAIYALLAIILLEEE